MANLTEAFNISMAVLAALPFFSLYFMPKSYLRTNRSALLRTMALGIVFLSFMIALEHLAGNSADIIGLKEPLSESQFFILGTLLLMIYCYYFSNSFCRALNMEIKIVEKGGVSRRVIESSITSAFRALRGRDFRPNWRTFQPTRPSHLIPGPLYLNYHVFTEYGHEENHMSTLIHLGQSPRNAQVYRVLAFVTGAFMLFTRAQNVERPDIRTFVRLKDFDAQLWFTVGALVLLLFSVMLVFFGEIAILEMEEYYNKAIRGEAASLAPKRPKLEKPEVDIDDVRQKAKARLEGQRKRAEEEKKKQIENVMGRLPEEEKSSLNPEIIRLEALIREVQSILFSTPPHRVVSAAEVAKKVGGKSTEAEVESIIIGLARRKEVRGRYDVWNKAYQGGSENEKFIEHKLRELTDGDTKNLSRLRIGADGTVEFQFVPRTSNGGQSEPSQLKKSTKARRLKQNAEETEK
ncbi:MAG: hypothetical protein ACXAB4_11415 [Candidatus Hodarchaeales archaeon]|jgi:hypothetical protein